MRHVLQIKDYSAADLNGLFRRVDAGDYASKHGSLSGKILGTVFLTSSLRTKTGFESAMLRLGGGVLAVDTLTPRAGPNTSESLADTIRTVSAMCDVLVVRSGFVQSPSDYTRFATCPVVNGGNGPGPFAEHPSQAIGDLYFIQRRLGCIVAPRILLVGVMNHRVIRSLLYGFALLGRSIVHVAYPDESAPLASDVEALQGLGLSLSRVVDISSAAATFDVIYHNGVPLDICGAVPRQFCLTDESAEQLRGHALLMHSMPRSAEYPRSLDSLPQAVFFEQCRVINAVRQQILCDLLTEEDASQL